MRAEALLHELLEAEDEDAVLSALNKRGLLENETRWQYLGRMPNNQSVVHNQQSTAAAALVEKYTNAVDAILMRRCRADGMDPRGDAAYAKFPTMQHAVDSSFGDLTAESPEAIRRFAAEQLVLYATGSKDRPCLSLFDAGEGQFAANFPETFCSLIHADASGSYKGAVPFVQGKFNMGGTGVLPFCSERRKLQLIVSRVPPDVAGGDDHEWAFTLMCFFPGKENPSWKYLVGSDGEVQTAGCHPLGLIPLARPPKAEEALPPRERKVTCGTLIKMYDFKAPKSNICGELYKQLKQFLLRPPLPLRIYECRGSYAAKVMSNTMWDVMTKWKDDDILEPGFEDGAGGSIPLSTGDQVPFEIRVFRASRKSKAGPDQDFEAPLTGLRALINGQSHAKRGEEFFKTKAVDKEHIASSLLVTLDFTGLRQDSKNALLMSNRETFREDPLLKELFDKLKRELKEHDELHALNNRRYEEKVRNAVEDEDGLKALEQLLSTDPLLATLFGSLKSGKVAATIADRGSGRLVPGTPEPFKGLDFPTYFRRANGSTTAEIEIPHGDAARVSFQTDVKNNYFTRKRPPRGAVAFAGTLPAPAHRLFNGRLTFTCTGKGMPVGAKLTATATISDKNTTKPFVLTLNAVIVSPRIKSTGTDPAEAKRKPKVPAGPSRPSVKERDDGPEQPPLKIERDPSTSSLVIYINTTSPLRAQARAMRPKEEEAAVDFVYKYGLALCAMGLLDSERESDEWKENDAECRDRIARQMRGLARVIVPLCLALPKNLPKKK